MRPDFRLSAWLLAACLILAGPALAQVELAPFTKLDTFTDIKLSPTGEYLAATVPLGDRTGLVVMRRANNEVTAQFALGKDTHIADFDWVNDGRLLLSMAEAFGMDDTPTATGELVGVDADGKNIELLTGYRATGAGPGTRLQTRT